MEMKWISVKKQLPKKETGQYLALNQFGQYMIAWYGEFGIAPAYKRFRYRFQIMDSVSLREVFHTSNGAKIKVTHWMPLPEPPKN